MRTGGRGKYNFLFVWFNRLTHISLEVMNKRPVGSQIHDLVRHNAGALLFYEPNNVSYFKEIFLKQFEFAVENYFG